MKLTGRDQSPPITDSPWFWALAFSLMGLATLAVFSRKLDRRQANIERNYQARSRVAERLATENNPAAPERIDDAEAQPAYATPGDTLIPLWPLAIFLGLTSVVAAEMLRRSFRARTPPNSPDTKGMPP